MIRKIDAAYVSLIRVTSGASLSMVATTNYWKANEGDTSCELPEWREGVGSSMTAESSGRIEAKLICKTNLFRESGSIAVIRTAGVRAANADAIPTPAPISRNWEPSLSK